MRRLLILLAIVLSILFLVSFYKRYVPLTKPYQTCLIPILATVAALTAARPEWGTLFLIFALPLINNLPYFFGLFEPLPQAPAALILCLFYAFGFLLHQLACRRRLHPPSPLVGPIAFFSGLVLVSGLITFLRYANFFPFRSNGVYELVTNVFGVTAGGAVMSLVFNALSYLTGFVFFFFFWNAGRNKEFIIKKITAAFLAGTLLAQLFGLYQHIFNPSLGNHPISLQQGLINATFKDALSFGTYMGLAGPFLIGLFFAFRGVKRLLAVLSLVLSAYLIWFTGSKSGLLSLVITLPLFFIFSARMRKDHLSPYKKRWLSLLFIPLLAASLAIAVFTDFPGRKISTPVTFLKLKEIVPNIKDRINTLGRMAVAMVGDYPLSGVGIGAYVIELPNYAKERNTWIYDPQSAENYLLQVASELGLIGLAAILWIFWKILIRIRRGVRPGSRAGPEHFIWVGAAVSVISFWLNTLSHSYIGSYEVIYTFWLMVGMVFLMRPSGEEDAEPRRFDRNLKIVAAASFVLFAISLLLSSLRSLSLEQRTRKFALQQNFGFYQQEMTAEGRPFRWTGRSAGLTLIIEKPVIKVPLMASHPDMVRSPVKVRVFLVQSLFRRKRLLAEIDFNRSRWIDCEFLAGPEAGQEAMLLFKVSRTWNPRKTTGVPDPRNLGIAVGPIEFTDEVK